jgi:hypothetical protein
MTLRFVGGQVESLFDEVLPEGVRELPRDLARLDARGRGFEVRQRSYCASWSVQRVRHGRTTS